MRTTPDGIQIVADDNSAPATDANFTQVPSLAAEDVVVIYANPLRKKVIIANDSEEILYLSLGPDAASDTHFTYAIPAKVTVAETREITGYSGEIHGYWPASDGSAYVTELV